MASFNFRVSFSEILIAFLYKFVAFSSKNSLAIAKSTIVVTNFPQRRLTKDCTRRAPAFIGLVARRGGGEGRRKEREKGGEGGSERSQGIGNIILSGKIFYCSTTVIGSFTLTSVCSFVHRCMLLSVYKSILTSCM